jgi:glycosyltransferase involved in cell wall biosynthesis
MERSLAILLEGLDDRFAVTVVSTDGEIAERVCEGRPGTAVTLVPRVASKFDLGAIRSQRRALAAAAPEVTLVSHPQLYSCQYGILAAWAARSPILSVVHCVLPRTDALQALLMRGAARLVTRLVGVSEAVARDAEAALHLPAGSVGVVYNGIPEVGPAAACEETGGGCRPRGQRRLLGCVGRLSSEKGFDVAVRALRTLPDCDLVVVGVGPRRGELEALARSLGVAERVSFDGWVPWPWTEHRCFDAVLVPSRYEGFGLVAVEAMAAGMPVVASKVAGLAEVVTDGVTGLLVDPDDPAALAGAVRRVLDDADLRGRLVAGGHDEARRRFSASAMVSAYEHILDALVASR